MKQLPLCVALVCMTAIIITMILCKVNPTNVVIGFILVWLFAQFIDF